MATRQALLVGHPGQPACKTARDEHERIAGAPIIELEDSRLHQFIVVRPARGVRALLSYANPRVPRNDEAPSPA